MTKEGQPEGTPRVRAIDDESMTRQRKTGAYRKLAKDLEIENQSLREQLEAALLADAHSRGIIDVRDAALRGAELDAARYRWLKEHGPTYHAACTGTPSMSIGRGPYIYLEVPANNSFSNLCLNGNSADSIIDAAIAGEGGKG